MKNTGMRYIIHFMPASGPSVLHVHPGVDDAGDSHQQTEQRYMVAEIFSHKRDVAAPRHDCIGGRKVMRPQEASVPELDSRREEREHCKRIGISEVSWADTPTSGWPRPLNREPSSSAGEAWRSPGPGTYC